MARIFFCIDLGGTNCKIAVFNEEGTLITSWKTSSKPFSNPENFLSAIKAELLRFEEFKSFSAISIGVPGLISADGVVVVSPNFPEWKELKVKQLIEQEFSCPVYVENDANLFVLGEGFAGSAKEYSSYVGITIGTGIGGGIVIDGKLLKGAKGMAGEIGHMVIHPAGPECGCGNKGCLEAYSSGLAMKRQMLQLTGLELEAIEIYGLAKKGDKKAQKVFEKSAYHLGIGIANIVNVLDVPCIVIGGGISSAFDIMEDSIKKGFKDHTFKIHFETVKIVQSQLKDLSSLYGAFSLIKKENSASL